MTRKDFMKIANHRLGGTGYRLATWSPGDGKTRYRIVTEKAGYFEERGPTAIGLKAADVMVSAFVDGYMAAERAMRMKEAKND